LSDIISTNYGRPQNQTRILQSARLDALPRLSKLPKFPRFLQWLLIRTNCYEYGLELVAFVCRILLLRKARKVEIPFRQLFVDLGPMYVPDETGHLVLCSCTRARTSYIQTLQSNYSWATPVDWSFALEGWDAGVRWAFDTSCTISNSGLESINSPIKKVEGRRNPTPTP
jgi:hypothetical protein